MKKMEALLLHFYNQRQELDFLNSLLKGTDIKCVSSEHSESFMSIVDFLKPTHVIAPFTAFQKSFNQNMFNFHEILPRGHLAIVRNGACEVAFKRCQHKFSSDNVTFISELNKLNLMNAFGFSLAENQADAKKIELMHKLKAMENEFLISAYHRSLTNLGYLSQFISTSDLMKVNGKMISNWHSLVGSVKMFNLPLIENRLHQLEKDAVEINLAYEELETRVQEHYTHILNFIHSVQNKNTETR